MTVIPLASSEALLETAGGKGANLARLARAGFPVPPGFIVSTDAYRAFVARNGLQGTVGAALGSLQAGDAAALDRVSATIREAFSSGEMPQATASAILAAYASLGGGPVAVRSSATAEDLPDLSFAGQQDTYLNVVGEAQLLRAVVECWGSLWTARAIGYRGRNGIPHDQAALAVVVQAMVRSDVSGVLFTANPLTGLLSESVIDATFGLGEALVSGLVEPDHFVVDARSGAIVDKTLGAKKVSARGRAGGGVETIPEDGAARQTLTDDEIRRLAAFGWQVQQEYGAPQDIEWAFAGGKLYLLQSRAVTSLFPVPEVSFDPLMVWCSFASVQGLVGPMTPLGRDAALHFVAGGGRLFGLSLSPAGVKAFASAGERLWIRISDLMRHPIGSRILGPALGYIEPSVRRIIEPLAADPRLGAGAGRLKLGTLRRLARFALPLLAGMARTMLRPEKARAALDAAIDGYLSTARVVAASDRFGRLANVVAFVRTCLVGVFQFILPRFVATFGPSMAALNLLGKITGEERARVLEVTRSLPRNVTTEMDLALWSAAATIRADGAIRPDGAAASLFRDSEAAALAARYLDGALPPAAQAAVARFMERYGMRGVGEIDFGQPRWREDPTPVMHALRSYMDIDPDAAPDVVFARGARAAEAAIEALAARAGSRPGGWLKEKAVRAAARRVRVLMGARESPKFLAIRLMGIARSALLDAGREFVEAGTLGRPDDLFFLQFSELESLSRDEPRDWKALVAGRRGVYERERRRRQVPRVLVSDGRAFYEGIGAETDSANAITGSPVSPGVVEGTVRVVLDPRSAHLAPGEILVCPGTDPAWTPLFMAAGGLITEVGGMMTHGSVVAREYGIPAVVGVHRATTRLRDGQRVRLDGTAGKIAIRDAVPEC